MVSLRSIASHDGTCRTWSWRMHSTMYPVLHERGRQCTAPESKQPTASCYPGSMRAVADQIAQKSRRMRFQRNQRAHIQLTPDDIAILGFVDRHRFLRSTHLARLIPHRSYKKLIERLCDLYHNGYLDRPRAQLDAYTRSGSTPMVYALGNRGAEVLSEEGTTSIDWTDKNRSVGRPFIDHTLLVADVMVAATGAVRSRPDVVLIDTAQIVDGVRPSRANPLKLAAETIVDGRKRELALVPDALFGLDFTIERKRKYFLVEADNGTMPIVRSDLEQTSFARKLMTYLAGGGQANRFGQQLGIGNFRVLTVTTSAERVASMLQALKTLTNGNGSAQFLFTDRAALLASSDLLSLEWTTGKGDLVTLSD